MSDKQRVQKRTAILPVGIVIGARYIDFANFNGQPNDSAFLMIFSLAKQGEWDLIPYSGSSNSAATATAHTHTLKATEEF